MWRIVGPCSAERGDGKGATISMPQHKARLIPLFLGISLAGLLLLQGPPRLVSEAVADDLKQTGTVDIDQVQVAFLFSGNLGSGRLSYKGSTYRFSVGGLGVGGIGLSKMEAVGEVYNMGKLGDFPGGYVQGRYGFAIGETSAGELWLQNTKGVVLHLKAKRQGLALSLGGDAVYIDFKD
jgi:hypothetical protein